jgi:hypothetical protein
MIKPFTRNVSKGVLRLVRWSLIVAIFVTVFSSSAFGQQSSDAPLTNAAVVKLVKAGFKEKTIIAIIDSRPNRFNLETEQLIQLKHNGVSDNVILAMLSFRDLVENDDERWADDSFFGRSNGQRTETDPKSSQGGSSDIFGSGSNSRSQSRGRNGGGEGENEGNVTGSATVRIIRPASESGNAPAKLERTPTLNNEAVIRLVEAGFSEGTIIKRIEDSPVEFDLSPDKVAELHKRRVSDPIIAAMTMAMSDGPVKPKTQPEKN